MTMLPGIVKICLSPPNNCLPNWIKFHLPQENERDFAQFP